MCDYKNKSRNQQCSSIHKLLSYLLPLMFSPSTQCLASVPCDNTMTYSPSSYQPSPHKCPVFILLKMQAKPTSYKSLPKMCSIDALLKFPSALYLFFFFFALNVKVRLWGLKSELVKTFWRKLVDILLRRDDLNSPN